jgi:hypothetical protein
MPGAHGYSVYHNPNLLATGVLIAAGKHVVGGYHLHNAGAAARYIKLYDKATAPTVGTDTPLLTLGVPAGAAVAVMIPNFQDGSAGIAFQNGIGIGATTAAADADTGAPTANDVIVSVYYL